MNGSNFSPYKRTQQVVFRQTILPLAGCKVEDECQFDGVITSVGFHFPQGCSGLVSVVGGHSGERCFPRRGDFSLDDASPVFSCYEPVSLGEILWAQMENTDGSNSHTVSMIFTIQELL